jgi:hypothetical protein
MILLVENSNHIIGNRTREFQASGALPQPTVPPLVLGK